MGQAKCYPQNVRDWHEADAIPYAETVSVVISQSCADENLTADTTLEQREIIGLIANVQDENGHGYNTDGVKLLSRERAMCAYLELWVDMKQNVITIPLRELLSDKQRGKYFKIHQKGYSSAKSKITFGHQITATEKQAIDLTFICLD